MSEENLAVAAYGPDDYRSIERLGRMALLCDLLREERELFDQLCQRLHLGNEWSPLSRAFRDVSDYSDVTKSMPILDLAGYLGVMGSMENKPADTGATGGQCLTNYFAKERSQ